MATPEQPSPPEAPDVEVQQSSLHSPAKNDKLKRIIKQHPQRGIPAVESVEPPDAPRKE